jgi:hypothetical protein
MSPHLDLKVPYHCLNSGRTPGIITAIAGPKKDLVFVLLNGTFICRAILIYIYISQALVTFFLLFNYMTLEQNVVHFSSQVLGITVESVLGETTFC